jgi:hypothetical protein
MCLRTIVYWGQWITLLESSWVLDTRLYDNEGSNSKQKPLILLTLAVQLNPKLSQLQKKTAIGTHCSSKKGEAGSAQNGLGFCNLIRQTWIYELAVSNKQHERLDGGETGGRGKNPPEAGRGSPARAPGTCWLCRRISGPPRGTRTGSWVCSCAQAAPPRPSRRRGRSMAKPPGNQRQRRGRPGGRGRWRRARAGRGGG